MSLAVMSNCWPLCIPPTAKSVLIALADCANDSGECWPSIVTLGERTCFSERAVQNAIRWLEENSIVCADRSNGRGTRYAITPERFQPPQEMHPRSTCTPAANDETPAGDAGDPRSRCVTPPQQVPSNRKEPSKNRKSNPKTEIDLPDWLPADVWADWVDHRQEIKKPMTARGAELTLAKLTKLRLKGHDPTELIENAIESRWQGIYAPRTEKSHANLQSSSKLSAVERVEQAIRDRRANDPGDDQDAALARLGYG